MRRLIGVYCVCLLVFFILGGSGEYRARRALKSRSVLLRAAAHRFAWKESSGFSYSCGKRVLFKFDFKTQALTKVTASDAEAADEDQEISNERIALIVTGVSIERASGFIAEETSLTSKDKIAALLGAFSGYNAGRYLFRKTLPACDGFETIDLLEHITGGELLRAMTLENLDSFVLVTESGDVPMLSKASQIRDAYYAYARRLPDDQTDCENGHGILFDSVHADFDCFESLATKLQSPSAIPTYRDYAASCGVPLTIADFVQAGHRSFEPFLGLGKIYYVDTRDNLVRSQNAALDAQEKELRDSLWHSPRWVARMLLGSVAFVVSFLILLAGIAVLVDLVPKIVLRLRHQQTPEEAKPPTD